MEEALGLIEYIVNKEIEDKMFARWIEGYQAQMSFEEFKNELMPIKKKTDKQIEQEIFDLFK